MNEATTQQTETVSKHLTEDKELEILRGLLQAMRDGKVESLTYKRTRRNGKEFECKVFSRTSVVNHLATSIEGKHNLAFLFLDTVRSALGIKDTAR